MEVINLRVFWEWYSSFFPVTEKRKVNPKLQFCKCGYSFTPSVFMKILMLLCGKYVMVCPRCGSRITLKLINHVVVVKRESVIDAIVWERG